MASPFAIGRLAVLALAFAAGTTPVRGADEGLAESLIRLRGEVEQLNGELEQLRQEQRTTLNGLSAQKAELNASVDRQQLAARELREKLQAKDSEASDAGAESDALKPAVLAAADALKAHIEAGLPFKQAERAADVDGFRNDVITGAIPPARAVNRLWALYEDEFRLTRENGLFSQTISIGSERVLADVVRLGSMALYFKTQDGRVGLAQRAGSGWRFVTVDDVADQDRINSLFDALRKQIRQGWFQLPLARAVDEQSCCDTTAHARAGARSVAVLDVPTSTPARDSVAITCPDATCGASRRTPHQLLGLSANGGAR